MNSKVVVAGSSLIILLFIGFGFYLTLRLRQNQITTTVQTPQQQGQVGRTYTETKPVSNKILKDTQEEVLSTQLLKRGVIVSYTSATNNLSLLEDKTDQLLDIDLSKVSEYKCWPEMFTNNNGEQFDIYRAFMPIETGSVLYIKGEEKKSSQQLSSDLVPGRKVMAIVNQTRDQEVSNVARDVAILGCL